MTRQRRLLLGTGLAPLLEQLAVHPVGALARLRLAPRRGILSGDADELVGKRHPGFL